MTIILSDLAEGLVVVPRRPAVRSASGRSRSQKLRPGKDIWLQLDQQPRLDMTYLAGSDKSRVHLMAVDAVNNAVNSPSLVGWLNHFTQRASAAKTEIGRLYDLIGEARTQVTGVLSNAVGVVTQEVAADDHTLGNRLLQYYVLGETVTRTGAGITLATDGATDQSLETVLGTLRIILEFECDDRWQEQLPWLANDQTPEGLKFRAWEQKAGNLADRVGAALGRTAASTAQGLISPLVKLPDEVVQAVAFVAGVTARKSAEVHMHSYVVQHPDLPDPPSVTPAT